MPRWLLPLLASCGLIVFVPHAQALISNTLPLQDVILDSAYIYTAKVEAVDPDKPSMTLTLDEQLKGKPGYKDMRINLTGDADAKKLKHGDVLLKRVAKDVTLIVFVVKKPDDNYLVFAFTNGTWFQITGAKAEDSDKIRWQFTHCEPNLRGTYKGTTKELKDLVTDVVAGKKSAPAHNPKEKPGFGPELEEEKPKQQSFSREPGVAHPASAGSARFSDSPPLAVIPSVVVGGPLALLAMLFPAVFGGLLLVLRRWMAVLTVASVNSLLYMVFSEFSSILQDFGWLRPVFGLVGIDSTSVERTLQGLHLDRPLTLWIAMLIATVAGTIWAWRRHLAAVQAQAELTAFDPQRPTMLPFFRNQSERAEAITPETKPLIATPALPPLPKLHTTGTQLVLAEAPRRGEHLALWIVSAIGVGGLIYCALTHTSLLSQPWLTLLVMWIGIWCGTLYAFYLRLTATARSPIRSGLPLEGVILLVMTIAAAGFAGTFSTVDVNLALGETGSRAEDEALTFAPRGVVWKFPAPGKGFIDSSPAVDQDHDRLYIASGTQSLQGLSGTLYCLGKIVDPNTGREDWPKRWQFNNNGLMKQVFCSPCLANGKVYVGEGLHQDTNCNMFCLDADNGQVLWQFHTNSHTESSPCYSDGKLYFGAGDDGMYCVDAETGDLIWNYQVDSEDIDKRLHIDANPRVVDGRVYCSSGVGDLAKATALFCVDANSGKEIWRRPTELPAWGGSIVDDDRVYFGIGNEGYVDDKDVAEGALLCLNRESGEQLWRFNTKGAVLGRPVVEGGHVFMGAKDGFFYCLERTTGTVVWKQNLGSPVLVAPTLVRCPHCGGPLCFYVLNGNGMLFCLNPRTGKPYWTFDALKASGIKPSESYPPQFYSSPAVTVTRTDKAEIHRIHFGAGIGDDFGLKGIVLCIEAEVLR